MNNDVIKYINDNLAKGISVDAIRQALLASGWGEQDINNYLSQAHSTPVAAISSQKDWKKMIMDNLPSLCLRIGLAFVFIYAAIFVSGDARNGAKYVPGFITTFIPLDTFLMAFGVFEVILALWILSGKFKLYSSLITAALLLTITVLNYEYFSTLFRNVAIIAAALALAAL